MDLFNENQGIIAIIGIIITVIISFFWIRKIIKIKQTQKSGNNSNNTQIWNRIIKQGNST